MKQAFIILILLFAVTAVLTAAELKHIIAIEFPMDNRDDEVFGHAVIVYGLLDNGEAYNGRSVYNWAEQDYQKKQLSPEEIKKLKQLVSGLPNSSIDLPKSRTVVVRDLTGSKEITRIFDRTQLPSSFAQILELLGGIRFEIEKGIKFTSGNSK